MSWKSCWNNYDNFEVAFIKLLINTLVPKKKRPLKEIPNWTNTYVWRVICIPLICDARRQAMWDSAHAWEVHCWKQHEASHLTLLYFLIHFNAKAGWVGTLPISLHHRSMECKLPFILNYSVNLEFHLTALLRRAGNMRLQSKITSVALPSSS